MQPNFEGYDRADFQYQFCFNAEANTIEIRYFIANQGLLGSKGSLRVGTFHGIKRDGSQLSLETVEKAESVFAGAIGEAIETAVYTLLGESLYKFGIIGLKEKAGPFTDDLTKLHRSAIKTRLKVKPGRKLDPEFEQRVEEVKAKLGKNATQKNILDNLGGSPDARNYQRKIKRRRS